MLELVPSFKNKRVTLRKHTLLMRYMILINLIIGAWYLYWRWTESLNLQALWFAIPLVCAETYMFLGGILFSILYGDQLSVIIKTYLLSSRSFYQKFPLS